MARRWKTKRDLRRFIHQAFAETYDGGRTALVTREDGTTKTVRVRRAQQQADGRWLIAYYDRHRTVNVVIPDVEDGNPEGHR